jgi:hypothetical protein
MSTQTLAYEMSDKKKTVDNIVKHIKIPKQSVFHSMYTTLIYDILIINLTCVCREKIISYIRSKEVSEEISTYIKYISLIIGYAFYYGVNVVVGNYEMLILEMLGLLWNFSVNFLESKGLIKLDANAGLVSFIVSIVSFITSTTGINILGSFVLRYLGKHNALVRSLFRYLDIKLMGVDFTAIKYNPDFELSYLQLRLNHGFPLLTYQILQWLVETLGLSNKINLDASKMLYWIFHYINKIKVTELIKSIEKTPSSIIQKITIFFKNLNEYIKQGIKVSV